MSTLLLPAIPNVNESTTYTLIDKEPDYSTNAIDGENSSEENRLEENVRLKRLYNIIIALSLNSHAASTGRVEEAFFEEVDEPLQSPTIFNIEEVGQDIDVIPEFPPQHDRKVLFSKPIKINLSKLPKKRPQIFVFPVEEGSDE